MSQDDLLFEVDADGVALITLNRPDRGNGITFDLPRELAACVERADLDPRVHVIALSGNGKGFCGGYDLVKGAERMLDADKPMGERGIDDLAGTPLDPKVFGRNHDPEYLALNPNAVVPTIIDEGFVLWESNAVVRYLAGKHGRGGLEPDSPESRALADQWMDWQQTTVHADVTFIFWAVVRDLKENQVPEKLDAAASRLAKTWQVADDHLQDRDYLCGDRLTMADIPLGAAVWRWYNMDTPRPSLPNVEA